MKKKEEINHICESINKILQVANKTRKEKIKFSKKNCRLSLI